MNALIPAAIQHLPVVAQMDRIKFSGKNLIILAETGAGKSIVVPPLEQMTRGGKILLRQPTRMVCHAIRGGLEKFWPNLKFATRTRDTGDTQEELDAADIIIFSDGSLPGLISRYGDEITAIHFDEMHFMSVQSETDLAVAKASGIPIRALSATIDPRDLVEYLDATVIEITGRTFPITRGLIVAPDDVFHRSDHTSLYCLVEDCMEDLASDARHGIFFLPTRDLTEKAAAHAQSLGHHATFAHGGVNSQALFRWMDERAGEPWMVFSTIVASVGVTFDVDSVWVGDEMIDSEERVGVQSAGTCPVDDNGLLQQIGRCGRTREGVATLVVPQANGRPVPSNRDWLSAQPGYVRTPVAPRPVTPPCSKTTPYSVLVQMASVGIKRHEIDLLSTLDDRELDHAEEWLWRNGVIQAGELTKLGRRIAAFPMSPREAHLVLGAPTRDLQLALCAALQVGNTYSLVRIKPGKDAWQKRAADPSWSIWPRNCQVWGSVPLTLAATLAKFSAESHGWAASVNLNDRPLAGALRDFEAAAAHICDEPLKALQAINFWDQSEVLWDHLRRHPLFKETRVWRGKGQPAQPFKPLDSVFADAWDLEGRVIEDIAVGIPRKQQMKKGGFFHPIGMFQFSPRSRP